MADIEPSFRRPDAVAAVPKEERDFRVSDGDDLCGLRDLQDTHRQYFVRVNMPFEVNGRDQPCSWGIWVEVSKQDFDATCELWDDPEQHPFPAFPGTLANKVWGYPDSIGLHGSVQLVAPRRSRSSRSILRTTSSFASSSLLCPNRRSCAGSSQYSTPNH